MKKLIAILMTLALPCMAQQRVVFSDGTNFWRYTGTGTTNETTNILTALGQNVSASNTTINGKFRLANAGLSWCDLVFQANDSGRQGVDDIDINSVDNGLDFKTTSATNITDDHFWSVAEILHDFKTNSTYIVPHVHFRQTNADQTNLWWLHYRWIELGKTNYAWTQIGPATNKFAFTSGQMHQMAEFPVVANPGISTISSIIDIKIHRDGNFGTGTILLKDVGIHYQRDSLGSDTDFNKTP